MLINVAVPGAIDESAIKMRWELNDQERNDNHTLCLNSAEAIGCTVANIGTQDLIEGRPHVVLCLISQIIKKMSHLPIQRLADFNLRRTHQLVGLVESDHDAMDATLQRLEELLRQNSPVGGDTFSYFEYGLVISGWYSYYQYDQASVRNEDTIDPRKILDRRNGVCIKGIDPGVTGKQLIALFDEALPKNCDFYIPPRTWHPFSDWYYAFANFSSNQQLQVFYKKYNGLVLNGRNLLVTYRRPRGS